MYEDDLRKVFLHTRHKRVLYVTVTLSAMLKRGNYNVLIHSLNRRCQDIDPTRHIRNNCIYYRYREKDMHHSVD